MDSKDPLIRLKASKLNIKDLLKVILDEIKDIKYQISLATKKEFSPI